MTTDGALSKVSTDGELKNMRTLVIGGYGGLGRAICTELAKQGADVAVAGRSADAAAAWAMLLCTDTGARTSAYRLDVTDPESVRAMVGELIEEWSGIDVLVNCASRLVTGPAAAITEEDWRKVVDANLSGAFWLSQAVGQHMLEAGGGSIIHLSSVRADAGGRLGFSAYGASKAGLNLLVKQLATEWGPHGVRVNAVAPGFVRTEFVEGAAQDEVFLQRIRARIPLGLLAEPEDIAWAVRYLSSPRARFVTGQVLYVDGGVTASH